MRMYRNLRTDSYINYNVYFGIDGLDIPPKKTAGQAPPVKRKQGHSLINPGSRK